MQQSQRNTTIELLRFFFMMCVVTGHVYGHGSGLNSEWMNSLGNNWTTIHHYITISIAKIGVVGFMLISGYMGMKLNVRKIIILFATLWFYSYVFQIIDIGDINVFHSLKRTTNYWFLCSYLFVAIIATLFEPALNHLPKRTWNIVTCSLIVYYGFYRLYIKADDHTTDFLLYIYLIGRYLRQCSHFLERYGNGLAIAALTLYLVVAFLIPDSYTKQWLSNDNALYILICYGLILFADRHSFNNRFINYWTASILGIYLITDSWVIRTQNYRILEVMMQNWFEGIGIVFLICIFCLIMDKLRYYIFLLVENAIQIINNKYIKCQS